MQVQSEAVGVETRELEAGTQFDGPQKLLRPRTFDAELELCFEGCMDSMPFQATMVSPTGMFLVTDLLFESGEVFSVTFSMPTGHSIAATAKVTELEIDDDGPHGMHLEFERIGKVEWGYLYDFASGS